MNWQNDAVTIHEVVVKKWDVWSEEDGRFLALAMAGEVGELLNLIKKQWRGDFTPATMGAWREKLKEEFADVRIYLELLARSFDVDLDKACEEKMPELLRRWPEAAKVINAKG
jgi:NTP pyrophosphatase (non-canonical NTP hydrolase)